MSKLNEIRETFLREQDHYYGITGDLYTASQMAAISTREEYGLGKDELIKIVNGDQDDKA